MLYTSSDTKTISFNGGKSKADGHRIEVENGLMLLPILEKHVICWLWGFFSSFLSGHLTILFHAPSTQKQKAIVLDVDPFYLFWQTIYSGSLLHVSGKSPCVLAGFQLSTTT